MSTLHRYILSEIVRILAVSAGALVLVMAFATAIKPLTEGMLGADTLLVFVVYMCPSMLKYALPFAAAMGVTLVYMRMGQDNEILACQASGIGYRKLLAPVFLLGVALMVTLLVLSGWVAPALYRRAAQTAQGDVVHALVQKMDNGEAFQDDRVGVALYANEAHSEEPPDGLSTNPDLQAERVISMSGVAVGKLDPDGKLESDLTAAGAKAVLYRDLNSGDALVAIRLEDPRLFNQSSEGGAGQGKTQSGSARSVDRIHFVLPNPVGDKMEFFSVAQLMKLRTHPEGFDKVRRSRAYLAKVVAVELFRRSVAASLATTGVPLRGPLGSETYTVYAPSSASEGDKVLRLAAVGPRKVVVEHRDASGGGVLRRWEADGGRMTFDLDNESGEPVAVLSLKKVRISDPRNPGVVSAKAEHVFDALAWPDTLLADTHHWSANQWLASTAKEAALALPQSPLATARQGLLDETRALQRKVVAQFHERGANSAACLLLAMLGAVMSLWRRGSQPLVVYFWCFLLAVTSLIVINTGANMARGSQQRFVAGLVLVWVPIALQAGFVTWILARLRRPGG